MTQLIKKVLINAVIFAGFLTLSPNVSYSADAYGTVCSSLSSGIGNAGLPCVVVDPDFGYGPPGGDNEASVEAALSYIYDTSIMLDLVAEVPPSGDFSTGTFGDFIITGTADDGEYADITWQYTGPSSSLPEFATVKAGSSAYAIFHLGGLSTGQLFTTGLIMNANNNNARGISHIRFWDSGDTPPQISEPAVLGLMGMALGGLYMITRRRRNV
tara:strand:+ start:4540 stop:5181 length:642 start_codon:yes stop_codon:yes gene_type:complete